MNIHAVVTVDLDGNVNSEARIKFDAHLASLGFVKRKLTTTWTAQFQLGVSRAGASLFIKQSVEDAAKLANVTHYELLFLVSEDQPVAIEVGKPGLGLRGLAGIAGYK